MGYRGDGSGERPFEGADQVSPLMAGAAPIGYASALH